LKILLLCGGGLGNVVHATPAIQAIRDVGADLTVWVGSEWGGVERFIDHGKIVVGTVPRLDAFDRVFATPYALTGKHAHLAAELGSKVEFSPVPMDGKYTEVEANMWFPRVLGHNGLAPAPRVKYNKTSPVDGEYVVIAPGVQRGWSIKCYPHWGAVAANFGIRIAVVFVGTKEDSQPEFDASKNLCGKLSLWETSGVLAKAGAVVGPDNGLTCLSASIGRPTVVLWGPTDTTKNRKFGRDVVDLVARADCRPCQFSQQMAECQHANCMKSISPALVAETVEAAFGRGK
jgi:ADP-heptose:LPS heptosyltransferase